MDKADQIFEKLALSKQLLSRAAKAVESRRVDMRKFLKTIDDSDPFKTTARKIIRQMGKRYKKFNRAAFMKDWAQTQERVPVRTFPGNPVPMIDWSKVPRPEGPGPSLIMSNRPPIKKLRKRGPKLIPGVDFYEG